MDAYDRYLEYEDKIYELNALNEFVFRSSDFKTLKLNGEQIQNLER